MATEVRIGLVGATGALGAEILRVLDGVAWRPGRVSALGRPTTSATHVDYGDQRLPIDDWDDEALDGLDALFVAVPRDVAAPMIDAAVQAGVPVIDASGASAEDLSVPLVVPWVNPEAFAGLTRGLVAIPDPAASLIASALGPLRRAGIEGPASATVFVPSSSAGRAGIDELSRQVVALFNTATPPRKVFPDGLAFDLLPAIGRPGDTGWTPRETEVAGQARRVAGVESTLDCTLVGVPVFSGISAQLTIALPRAVPVELIERVLSDGGLKAPEAAGPRYLPRPRRVEGQPFAHFGRVRLGADGRTLQLWLSMDNLRSSATAAVAIAALLLRETAQGEA